MCHGPSLTPCRAPVRCAKIIRVKCTFEILSLMKDFVRGLSSSFEGAEANHCSVLRLRNQQSKTVQCCDGATTRNAIGELHRNLPMRLVAGRLARLLEDIHLHGLELP